MEKINIAIIGFGRFGRLLAGLLKKHGSVHIISRGSKAENGYPSIGLKDLKTMDWVIPAVPISALEGLVRKIGQHLKPGALVMDVCSVKKYPCQWLKKHLPVNVEILGTHPMFGPDSAKYGLKGLSMVFCPVRIKHSRLKAVMQIFKNLGLETIIMAPESHDRQAAVSLSLVHYIGRGLGLMPVGPQQVSTLGFERLLAVNETVENDSWQLFIDMHKFNPYAAKIREKYLKYLKAVDNKIKSKTSRKSS